MSFDALSWAAKQRPGNLAAKMVLLALANWAGEDGCAFPSTAALADFGDMDHKTATTALDRLITLGLISDTGSRAGRTKQIKVYQLNLESLPKTEASQKRKPPVFSGKDPQKRGTDTVRDTISEAKASSVCVRGTRIPDDWVPTYPYPPSILALVELWPPGREVREIEGFRDYWATRTRDAKKSDWDRTFHNRIRDQHDRIIRESSYAKRPANDRQNELLNPMVRAAAAREARYAG